MNRIIFTIALLTFSINSSARAYLSSVEKLQGESPTDAYNAIHLDKDITDSPCADTNTNDRFAIYDNNVQQSIALAAVMANKKVQLMPNGNCNAAGIEGINYITIFANQ